MATKVTGLGWTTFEVDDAGGPTLRDIRDALTDVQFSTPRAVQDVTGIDESANQRLLLLADCSFTMNGVFDTSANGAHAVFSTVPTTSVLREILLETNGKTLTVTGTVLTDYQITRAATGELTFSVPASNGDGSVPTWS